jgi:hypothetical protein
MLADRLVQAAAAMMLIAAASSAAVAECKPDTAANHDRTLVSGISALHVDELWASIRVNSQDRRTGGAEFGLALCRWPAYTFGVGAGGTVDHFGTSYIAPGSADYHPNLEITEAWLSVTRRWRLSAIVHPMASVRIGSIMSSYPYWDRVKGPSVRHVDGLSRALLIVPTAGVEASVFKYMSVYVNAGPRLTGKLNTPGASEGQDVFASVGLALGKMR